MWGHGGGLENVNKIFSQDVLLQTAMILGNVTCGKGGCIETIQQMQQESIVSNPITFVGVLKACASVLALAEGRLTHEQNIESDFKSNVFVRSSLVDIYAKHGRMEGGLEGVQQDAIT
jgi:hypothetical protein